MVIKLIDYNNLFIVGVAQRAARGDPPATQLSAIKDAQTNQYSCNLENKRCLPV